MKFAFGDTASCGDSDGVGCRHHSETERSLTRSNRHREVLILIILDENRKNFKTVAIGGSVHRLGFEIAGYFADRPIVILFVVERLYVHHFTASAFTSLYGSPTEPKVFNSICSKTVSPNERATGQDVDQLVIGAVTRKTKSTCPPQISDDLLPLRSTLGGCDTTIENLALPSGTLGSLI